MDKQQVKQSYFGIYNKNYIKILTESCLKSLWSSMYSVPLVTIWNGIEVAPPFYKMWKCFVACEGSRKLKPGFITLNEVNSSKGLIL